MQLISSLCLPSEAGGMNGILSLKGKDLIYGKRNNRYGWIGVATKLTENGALVVFRNGKEQAYSIDTFVQTFCPAHWSKNNGFRVEALALAVNKVSPSGPMVEMDYGRAELQMAHELLKNGADRVLHMVLNAPSSLEKREESKHLWCDFHPNHYALHCTKCAEQREEGIKRDQSITMVDPADEQGEFYVYRPKGDKPKHKHTSFAKATAEAARVANLFPGESIQVLRVAAVYCAERVVTTKMNVEVK